MASRLRPIAQRIRPKEPSSDNTPPPAELRTTEKPRSGALVVTGVASVIVLGLLLMSFQPRPAPVQALQPTGAPLIQTVIVQASPTPSPRPTCNPATPYLTTINEQEQHLRYDAAISTAESALNDRAVCPADRPIVADRYVSTSIEALFAQPFSPERSAQREAVDSYTALKRAAAHYGASLPPSLQLADRAAQAGRFLLAKAVYDDAIYAGEFQHQDIARVRAYASNLYNVGFYFTQQHDSPIYQEGLAFLSASHQVAVAYKTGQAEAWGRLKELLGANEKGWPAPIDTPLLPAQ